MLLLYINTLQILIILKYYNLRKEKRDLEIIQIKNCEKCIDFKSVIDNLHIVYSFSLTLNKNNIKNHL